MDLLHGSLQKLGVDSMLICEENPSGRSDIRIAPRWQRSERWLRHLTSRLGLNDIHRIGSWALTKDEAFREADVIHIHGLHSGFLSYLALPHLTREKPAVFTLRDHWPLTGHCAYTVDCQRWKIGCGSCPYLGVRPAVRRDATRIEWRLKQEVYKRSQLTFVAQNEAQLRDAEESLIAPYPKTLIPASVDTDIFRPMDRTSARASLGLDSSRKVVLFVATRVDNPRKGGHYLLEGLKRLPDQLRSMISLLVLGRNSEEFVADSAVPGIALEFTTDQQQIALAYNAADVLAFPSTNDTFGLVWAEALACGTPVVGFRIGGTPDHITPGETGVVVPIGDIDGFADGLTQILTASPDRQSALRYSSREYAVSELSSAVGAKRYLELYSSLL